MELDIDIKAYVRGVQRRWLLVTLIFVVGAAIAVVVAMKLPATYESTARILVESQQIPDDLARSTVTASAAERLQIIQQRLMTRRNLLEIIELLGLFADRDDMNLTEKVEAVRNATQFASITFSGGRNIPQQVAAFTITYSSDSAATASQVANEYVTQVLEQNLEARSERATETRSFFRQEVDRLANVLLELETEISSYQNENVDALPQSLDFRLSEISNLQDRLFASEQRRAQLADERRFFENALEEGATPLIEGATALSPVERDLAELRRSLLQQRSVLSENHPTIRALKARLQAMEASLAGQAPADGDPANADPGMQPRFAEVRSRLEAIDRQAARMIEEEGRLMDRIEARQASVDKTPEIQMALSAMERRYASLQEQYQGTVTRLAEAAIGERLEINRQAERFEVIEQASVPERPVKPNRTLIAVGGVVGSLFLGLGLALMLEIMNPAIRSAADLQRKLDLRPIVSVPYIPTRRERVRRRVGWLAGLSLVGVVGGGALWTADQYYLPLSVLVKRVAEKVGLLDMLQQIQNLLG